ncbi:helicase-related protein [Paenibacillus sp. SGZ-1009]|uniref:helicase-related protein n=1 Tax=Paenibacillus campi TaxID=3106031 RepID=UPI002AFF4A69|nr:helicase-related protein [Paenibacillus sp. SGZ-1009]
MKLDLYATEHEQGWLLHVSLDMRVDSLWWAAADKRKNPCQSLWQIASGLPASCAFACMRHFNRTFQHKMEDNVQSASLSTLSEQAAARIFTCEKGTASAAIVMEPISQWLRAYMTSNYAGTGYAESRRYSREAVAVNSTAELTNSSVSLNVTELVFPCRLWSKAASWSGSGNYMLSSSASGQLQGDLQHHDCKKQLTCGAIAIAGLLNGRSLLLPELHQLLAEKKSPYSVSWRSCLQLAYLQKHIRLLDSVYFHVEAERTGQPFSLRSLRIKRNHDTGSSAPTQAVCRRCGSGTIRYTACAGCGSAACGYCEQCLMMGRSRQCSLLIQSVRPPIAVRKTEQLAMEPMERHLEQTTLHSEYALYHTAVAATPSLTANLKQPIRLIDEQDGKHTSLWSSAAVQMRWGLSEAQTDATVQVLTFLQHEQQEHAVNVHCSTPLLHIREQGRKVWRLCKAILRAKANLPQLHSSQADAAQIHMQLPEQLEQQPHKRNTYDTSAKVNKTSGHIRSDRIVHPPTRDTDDHDHLLPQNRLWQMSQLPLLRQFLLWAVTGAGKTEMIFPLIEYTIHKGQRVLIATPRRDVVLELAPRLQQAFPKQHIVALYGGSAQQWEQSAITIATTHQLLRYCAAFDLVVIDEIDAFPYDGNPVLAYGAYWACRPEGRFVYLSATPSAELRRAIRQERLMHVKVPVRFHGYPLPVPSRMQAKPFVNWEASGKLPWALLQHVQHSIDRGAQIFWFMPRIAWIEPMVVLLQRQFPLLCIAGTSSQDEQRAHKVLLFRDRQIRILVTTTILERGVTIPHSDVYIVDAHDRVYPTAALIQMAGRAGRSKHDPYGKVIFIAAQYNRSQRQAMSQIRLMNRIARKRNYITTVKGRK